MAAAMIPVMIGTTALSAYGQYQQGKAAEQAGRMQAASLRGKGLEVQASSQRQAQEEERLGQLAQSRALAVAAASGGGVDDPTVVNLMADLAGQTHYRKMAALYGGQSERSALEEEAGLAEWEGGRARKTSQFGAITTALSGATSMFSKYGLNSPKNPNMNMYGNTAYVKREL